MPPLNIFIDESGNFDFSPNGTKFFILTAVSTTDCPELLSGCLQLRHRIAASGLDLEEFHATEDRQVVRDQMFGLLGEHVAHRCFTIDAIIAQKNKVNPAIREETIFYPRLLKILLHWIFRHRTHASVERINVWAARIGTKKKRITFEKAVKTHLANELETSVPYDISCIAQPPTPCSRWRTTAAGRSTGNGRTARSAHT